METRRVTGREIAAALRMRGLTQWDLAVKAGINQASISAALRGHEALGPARQARLIAAIVELGLTGRVTPGEQEPTFDIPVESIAN
jgi:lambda repressor-like predicted transcriptional regulator